MKVKNVSVRMLVLVGVLLISALALMSNTRVNALSGGLTTLSAGDSLAYRWDEMARFYAGLTTLSAGDVAAYRWEAMARFYAGPDLSAYHLSERAAYSQENGMAVYHASEWGW